METNQPIRIRPGEPGRLIVFLPYSPERVEKIKTIPGRQWNTEKKYWTVPRGEGTAGRLAALFTNEIVDIDPSLLSHGEAPLAAPFGRSLTDRKESLQTTY